MPRPLLALSLVTALAATPGLGPGPGTGPGPGAARAQAQLAEVHCAPTAELVQVLQRRFGVSRAGSGLRSPDQMMELWRDEAGDWALVARYAGGTSCILAMGAHWDAAEPRG